MELRSAAITESRQVTSQGMSDRGRCGSGNAPSGEVALGRGWRLRERGDQEDIDLGSDAATAHMPSSAGAEARLAAPRACRPILGQKQGRVLPGLRYQRQPRLARPRGASAPTCSIASIPWRVTLPRLRDPQRSEHRHHLLGGYRSNWRKSTGEDRSSAARPWPGQHPRCSQYAGRFTLASRRTHSTGPA